ncbi:hypothetical protein HPB48_021444 [Haemaphysalis longicornis]|uniref:Uncharacterized protein n=1 Tax=Haemaphysalis longicornis TaxID=44386 RepID=A0A9J6FM67_HAELO|nr:hypothetical protein HPB48_021444 [Haemaphysalis longicornis]
MAPQRSTTALRSYAAQIKSVCPKLPAVSTLVRKFRCPETGFQNHKITFPLNCTAGDSTPGYETCQIFQELPRWNEVLYFVKLELKETSPGNLTVSPLSGTSFPAKSQEVQRAVVCLHWLLSQHRCVVSVRPHQLVLNNYPELFWDAIKRSLSVRTLRLHYHKFDAETTSRFFYAVSRITRLETLELNQIEFSVDVKTKPWLTHSLTSVTSLKTLSLTNIQGMSNTEDITELLRANHGLTKLKIDANLGGDDIVSFYEFLSVSASLTELTIIWSGAEPACTIGVLFEGLMGNGVLRKLCLGNFCFDLVDSTLLSDMLTANTTLQELAFFYCHWRFLTRWPMKRERQARFENAKQRWGLWWRVDPFITAIKNSTSLRRLVFDENPFLDEEMGRLLVAVKEKGLVRGALLPVPFLVVCHRVLPFSANYGHLCQSGCSFLSVQIRYVC